MIFAGRLRFGRLFFVINMLIYVGYLICLSSFLIVTYPGKLDRITGCPFNLTNADADTNNHTTQVCFYIASDYSDAAVLFGFILFYYFIFIVIFYILLFLFYYNSRSRSSYFIDFTDSVVYICSLCNRHTVYRYHFNCMK